MNDFGWHSTALKHVSRSTLQAETLSLLLGSEEADHLRFVFYGIKDPNVHRANRTTDAMDEIYVDCFTDCKSLFQSGLHVVTDKITDRVPDGATTALHWTTTDRMLADPSTKGMKHAACRLGSFDERHHVSLILTKEKECENKDETTIDMDTYS